MLNCIVLQIPVFTCRLKPIFVYLEAVKWYNKDGNNNQVV